MSGGKLKNKSKLDSWRSNGREKSYNDNSKSISGSCKQLKS